MASSFETLHNFYTQVDFCKNQDDLIQLIKKINIFDASILFHVNTANFESPSFVYTDEITNMKELIKFALEVSISNIPNAEILQTIKELIDDAKSISPHTPEEISLYIRKVKNILDNEMDIPKDICKILISEDNSLRYNSYKKYKCSKNELDCIITKMKLYLSKLLETTSSKNKTNNTKINYTIVFSQFHKVAKQLGKRYDKRETLKINDEYDVQDLLHALLKTFISDIRKEEWNPSYAGTTSRQDLLLKKEKTIIETKFITDKLKDKQVVDQLIIDIEKYQTHPDCEKLICFIYDPNGILNNPEAIKTDLEKFHDFVEIIINPS